MAFKDLLVHLDDTKGCAQRVGAALALAKRQGASVTGVALALESTISKYLGMEFPASVPALTFASLRGMLVSKCQRHKEHEQH